MNIGQYRCKNMKVVIIGSGAGGLTVASNIRRYSENSDITVVTLEKQVAYSHVQYLT